MVIHSKAYAAQHSREDATAHAASHAFVTAYRKYTRYRDSSGPAAWLAAWAASRMRCWSANVLGATGRALWRQRWRSVSAWGAQENVPRLTRHRRGASLLT